jgi:hypothetical protein
MIELIVNIQDAAIGIGIVFLVIGVILGIGGAKSKEHEEQTIY